MRGTLQLWRIGVKSRAEALEEMARELDVPAMTRFVATVSEALAFGTPLAETLERQAQVIREEQRAQMEEEVEKVPVKMLIPLGTLIVPAMLLAILGPLLGPAMGLA
jgi:tight adherence protein C